MKPGQLVSLKVDMQCYNYRDDGPPQWGGSLWATSMRAVQNLAPVGFINSTELALVIAAKNEALLVMTPEHTGWISASMLELQQ